MRYATLIAVRQHQRNPIPRPIKTAGLFGDMKEKIQ